MLLLYIGRTQPCEYDTRRTGLFHTSIPGIPVYQYDTKIREGPIPIPLPSSNYSSMTATVQFSAVGFKSLTVRT